MEGHTVLFAFEEAIGYMFGNTVLDKDGISAAAILAEYGGWLQEQGRTFHDQLYHLYSRYNDNYVYKASMFHFHFHLVCV